jgi:teichuronic acid biosynthesis glycosyltransferase TuaG
MGSIQVSIITPSYKSGKFISQTIESVLIQSYQNWEMIIVDDFSPDNSNEIIEEYCKRDCRIKLIKLEKNSGPAIARNEGIKQAQGRYIAFLDSDDKWFSNKLEKQLNFMILNEYDFTFTSYNRFDNNGNILSLVKAPEKIDYKLLLKTCYPGCLTVMVSKSCIENIFFSTETKREDYAFWLNVIKKTGFAYGLDIELAHYRVHSSQSSNNKIKMVYENWKLYKNIEKLNYFLSIYYFLNYFFRGIFRTYLIKHNK